MPPRLRAKAGLGVAGGVREADVRPAGTGETEPGEQAGGPADATPLALPLTGADSEVSLPRAAIVRGVGGREPLYPSLPQFTNTADRIECP